MHDNIQAVRIQLVSVLSQVKDKAEINIKVKRSFSHIFCPIFVTETPLVFNITVRYNVFNEKIFDYTTI